MLFMSSFDNARCNLVRRSPKLVTYKVDVVKVIMACSNLIFKRTETEFSWFNYNF